MRIRPIALLAVCLAGCSSGKSGPVDVRISFGKDRMLHVMAPGGGVSQLADGKAWFTIAQPLEGFEIRGEATAGDKTIDMVLDLDTKRPLRLELAGMTDIKMQKDGQPADPAAELPAGKYKLVLAAKLP